jgi:enamine deaminase RidA (YjgF/YER057c/UK114 family)
MRLGVVNQTDPGQAGKQSGWEFFPAAGEPRVSIPVGQPLLYGPSLEFMSIGSSAPRWSGPVCYIKDETHLAGFVRLPVEAATMEEVAYAAYREAIKVIGSRSFCRLWNYVPRINCTGPSQLENYKLFCIGRNRAFAETFGERNNEPFSAASATGSIDDHLTVVFFSTHSAVDNWENPEQTPAYEYPPQYGPRSPSFARASMCRVAAGEVVFISGTAAIKGHETQFPGDFAHQLELTLDNLDLTLAKAGLQLGTMGERRKSHFKIFLRNRANLDPLLERMKSLLGSANACMVVEAQICRADLEVEIEVTVLPDA